MNIRKTTARLALITGVLLAATGCYTTQLGKDYPFQGKVWRGDIARQFRPVALGYKHTTENIEIAHLDPLTQQYQRLALVRVLDGAFFKDVRVGPVVLPDTVEYEDLEKGAIVDFIFQKGTDTDFRVSKFNRIVRVVCSSKDKACIKRVRSEGTVNTVIDPAPDGGAVFGNTYLRQVTLEDRAKYE